MFKKLSAVLLALLFAVSALTACSDSGEKTSANEVKVKTNKVKTNLSKPDKTKWNYNKEYDIFYQIGIDYCEKPADKRYEQLSIFVPAAYMNADKNKDGTYTCKLSDKSELCGYTCSTAPIVIPVHTPAYASDKAMTEEMLNGTRFILNDISSYTSKGFVYVHAGCRGGYEGAPAGVTDLKAAVRYVRYSDDLIAGSAEKIFVFGMSGGGAQAAILGASGNSSLYDPYLKAIGAIQGVSDAVTGTMSWCPVTELDTANAEYEWMMGCTRPSRSDEEQAISDNLAKAYADYINKAGFTDKDGKALTLKESDDGIYQSGSYYDYIKSEIERSLNNYLADTDFPDGDAQDYINSLNADRKWITYDKKPIRQRLTAYPASRKPANRLRILSLLLTVPYLKTSCLASAKARALIMTGSSPIY